jgi:hypothetical protein
MTREFSGSNGHGADLQRGDQKFRTDRFCGKYAFLVKI